MDGILMCIFGDMFGTFFSLSHLWTCAVKGRGAAPPALPAVKGVPSVLDARRIKSGARLLKIDCSETTQHLQVSLAGRFKKDFLALNVSVQLHSGGARDIQGKSDTQRHCDPRQRLGRACCACIAAHCCSNQAWGRARPGRPVPTLLILCADRGARVAHRVMHAPEGAVLSLWRECSSFPDGGAQAL